MKKLVRDKVVENIEARGNKVAFRILTDEEFIRELKVKLKEEVEELCEVDLKDKDGLKNELADVQLIVDYLLKTVNLSRAEMEKIEIKKIAEAGGFDKRIYTETVSLQDNDKWVDYYRKKGFAETENISGN